MFFERGNRIKKWIDCSIYLLNLFIQIEEIPINDVLREIAVFDSRIEFFLVDQPEERVERENRF